MKVAIVLFCLFVASISADHRRGHGHHHGKDDDHYCYSKDARRMKKEVCDLVTDVTDDAEKIFDAEMEKYKETMEKNSVESKETGESKFGRWKEAMKRRRMNVAVYRSICKSSAALSMLVINKCKNCTKEKECTFDDEFAGKVEDILEVVMGPLDKKCNAMLGSFLDDIESLTKDSADAIDAESMKADDYLRKESEGRVNATVDAIITIAKSACKSIKEEGDDFKFGIELRKALHSLRRYRRPAIRAIMKIKELETDIEKTGDKMKVEFTKDDE